MTALLAYRPFISPLPVWDYWYLLIVPLCLAVSVVYKAIRLERMRDVPKQAILITLWILGAMIGAAALLMPVVRML